MIYVSGWSDDLVEVDGDVSEEFTFTEGGHVCVTSPDGGRLLVYPDYFTGWSFRVTAPTGIDFETIDFPDWHVRTMGWSDAPISVPTYTTVVEVDAPEGSTVAWSTTNEKD